jgi:hypothetical protein
VLAEVRAREEKVNSLNGFRFSGRTDTRQPVPAYRHAANGPADTRCHAPPLSRSTCGLIGACMRHNPHMKSWKINGWYTSTVPWAAMGDRAVPGFWAAEVLAWTLLSSPSSLRAGPAPQAFDQGGDRDARGHGVPRPAVEQEKRRTMPRCPRPAASGRRR